MRKTNRNILSHIPTLAAALACCLVATASHANDEREIVEGTTKFPWHTAAKVDIVTADGGLARGSGMLIAPCTALTNGHVVYDVSDAKFRTIGAVHPGSRYDNASGHVVDSFGQRTPVMLATNNKYAAGKGDGYDYGALFFDRSFAADGITTYIPLSFGYRPTYVNMAAYPSGGLPSSEAGVKHEMWRSFGAVGKITTRMLYTDATSTGGASGAGVWAYSGGTGERRVVAVNRAHSSKYDGIHVRLTRYNEDVITEWQRQPCAERSAAPRLRFDQLLSGRRTLQGEAIPMLAKSKLRVVDAPARVDGTPAQRVSQVIENTFYQWEEYTLGNGARVDDRDDPDAALRDEPSPARYIRRVAPEQRSLTAAEAQVLLSASALWQRAPRLRREPVRSLPKPETFSVYPTAPSPAPTDDPLSEQTPDTSVRQSTKR